MATKKPKVRLKRTTWAALLKHGFDSSRLLRNVAALIRCPKCTSMHEYCYDRYTRPALKLCPQRLRLAKKEIGK